jgi:uncharacterized protein YoxC
LERIGEPSSTIFGLLGDVLSDLEALSMQLDVVLSGIADLEMMIEAIDIDFTSVIQQIQNLIDAQDAALAAMLAAIDELNQAIADLNVSLDEALAGLEAQLAQHDTDIKQLLDDLLVLIYWQNQHLTAILEDTDYIQQVISDLEETLGTLDIDALVAMLEDAFATVLEEQKEEPAAGETHGMYYGESVGFYLMTTFAGNSINTDSLPTVTVLNGTDGSDITSPGNITVSNIAEGIYLIVVEDIVDNPCHYGDPVVFVVEWSYTDPSTSHVYHGTDHWVADSGEFWDAPSCSLP